MKIIDEERDTLYPHLYKIGNRLTRSFNDQAEELGVASLAAGLPFENPTKFSIYLFNRPIPLEKIYLWQTGPATFEDYGIKAGFAASSQAFYASYLAMMNSGINPFPRGSFITCTKFNEEDLQKTETAFGITLRVLKENKLVGIVE